MRTSYNRIWGWIRGFLFPVDHIKIQSLSDLNRNLENQSISRSTNRLIDQSISQHWIRIHYSPHIRSTGSFHPACCLPDPDTAGHRCSTVRWSSGCILIQTNLWLNASNSLIGNKIQKWCEFMYFVTNNGFSSNFYFMKFLCTGYMYFFISDIWPYFIRHSVVNEKQYPVDWNPA